MGKILSVEGPQTNAYELADGSVANFETSLFYGDNGSAHLVLSKGELGPKTRLRMASECTLAQGGPASILCDCGSQLRKMLQGMAKADGGNMLLYSFGREYEGRGAGVEGHFKAYQLHTEKGLSSSEAYKALGMEVDPRQYHEPIQVLNQTGLAQHPFKLLTNNVRKLRPLHEAGLTVTREGFETPVTTHNIGQIASRIQGMSHRFSADTQKLIESIGIRLKTVDECKKDGTDLSVTPEVLATGILRYGPVYLPLAVNRNDDGDVLRGTTYLYICNGHLYHVITGADHLASDVDVAALPACIPGDNFSSTQCECRKQLVNAMKSLQINGNEAVLIYAIGHHSLDPHAKIPLDALRSHAFQGQQKREPMPLDHPDVQVILESLGADNPKQMKLD